MAQSLNAHMLIMNHSSLPVTQMSGIFGTETMLLTICLSNNSFPYPFICLGPSHSKDVVFNQFHPTQLASSNSQCIPSHYKGSAHAYIRILTLAPKCTTPVLPEGKTPTSQR